MKDSEAAAAKLMRLLPWCANPLGAAVMGASIVTPGHVGGTRQRTAERAADEGDRVRLVRVRHAGGVWEKQLNWEEIAIVREASPGRVIAGSGGGTTQPRFGRGSLRER